MKVSAAQGFVQAMPFCCARTARSPFSIDVGRPLGRERFVRQGELRGEPGQAPAVTGIGEPAVLWAHPPVRACTVPPRPPSHLSSSRDGACSHDRHGYSSPLAAAFESERTTAHARKGLLPHGALSVSSTPGRPRRCARALVPPRPGARFDRRGVGTQRGAGKELGCNVGEARCRRDAASPLPPLKATPNRCRHY